MHSITFLYITDFNAAMRHHHYIVKHFVNFIFLIVCYHGIYTLKWPKCALSTKETW